MAGMTVTQIGEALHNAEHYRIVRAQQLASEGPADGISGTLVVALGLRETRLENVEGGAKKDAQGKWVALGPEDAERMDVGALQMSRKWAAHALRLMPAVKVGTWGPIIPGKTPLEFGYVPTWTHAIRATIDDMREAIAYALDHDATPEQAVRIAIAAHNAGLGGAMDGYRDGDIDKNTAHGNYSADVLEIRTVVNHWIGKHPNWRFG